MGMMRTTGMESTEQSYLGEIVSTPSTWKLKITKAQFIAIYGVQIDASIFERDPIDDEDFINNFLASKLWRLNNLYTITDKDANPVIFNMNYAQHKVYAASLAHARLLILKSRQQGISTLWLVSFFDDTMTIPHLKSGLMAQGEAEASTLLERIKFAWEELDPEIKSFFDILLVKDNTSELAFSTKATLFIRNSFRSTTLQRLHISEYGKIANANPKRALETKTGTLQAIKPGNTCVIESTAEGDNDFKHMWDKSVIIKSKLESFGGKYPPKAFQPLFLSWLEDPDCRSDVYHEPTTKQAEYFESLEAHLDITVTPEQKNFWIGQYEELGDLIYQEYPATPEEAFTKVNDGSYYGTLFKQHVTNKGRIKDNLYDPNLEVFVAMDLGVNDYFTLVFFQKWKNEWRIIDEYYNTGEGLAHYVDVINKTGYNIEALICPHDIAVQELGSGQSRLAVLRRLTSTPVLVLPKSSVADGIESVRGIIPHLWVDSKCKYIIGCFTNYSKEWDTIRQVWKNSPLHDKWSHGADVVRYMATNAKARIGSKFKVENSRRQSGRFESDVVDGMSM